MRLLALIFGLLLKRVDFYFFVHCMSTSLVHAKSISVCMYACMYMSTYVYLYICNFHSSSPSIGKYSHVFNMYF